MLVLNNMQRAFSPLHVACQCARLSVTFMSITWRMTSRLRLSSAIHMEFICGFDIFRPIESAGLPWFSLLGIRAVARDFPAVSADGTIERYGRKHCCRSAGLFIPGWNEDV